MHRRLHAQTLCAKRTRTLAAQKRSEASNSCLAAFNRGVTDECFDSCVAAANGAEWHPGARPRDVYDQRGRPCTSAQNWDHCRAGYEAAVEQTRALFFAPEPEPEPEPEPRRRLEEKKAPVLEAATAHVKDVGRGTGAVEDVVVVQYEGSQVPLVVREDQSSCRRGGGGRRAAPPFTRARSGSWRRAAPSMAPTGNRREAARPHLLGRLRCRRRRGGVGGRWAAPDVEEKGGARSISPWSVRWSSASARRPCRRGRTAPRPRRGTARSGSSSRSRWGNCSRTARGGRGGDPKVVRASAPTSLRLAMCGAVHDTRNASVAPGR